MRGRRAIELDFLSKRKHDEHRQGGRERQGEDKLQNKSTYIPVAGSALSTLKASTNLIHSIPMRYMLLLLFSHWTVLTLCILWTAAHQASLSFTISQSLLKLMFIE